MFLVKFNVTVNEAVSELSVNRQNRTSYQYFTIAVSDLQRVAGHFYPECVFKYPITRIHQRMHSDISHTLQMLLRREINISDSSAAQRHEILFLQP